MSAVSEDEPAGATACPHCDAPVMADQRFCTNCGGSLTAAAEVAADLTDQKAARLVECDVCGAGNAQSRPLCAVCSAPLRDEIPGGDALPEELDTPVTATSPDGPERRDVPTLVLSLVILAALVTAGVMLSLLSSRFGPLDDEAIPTGVALQAASASSALGDHPASLAIDGDTATAWTEAASGSGQDQWLEVTMASEVSVSRILLWNGDQRDDTRFDENGRAAAIRIEVTDDVADRQFRVVLEDTSGPQQVDLPEPVVTDRVRVVVEDAIAGDRYTDLAISEIVVQAAP
ncbi:NADase-type glycan-binding domain-containing protein [Euzebya tangerina]|uniref:NADase-type glycan-binding domain-containing protein n=1 Tax=Euzebya tangerina TaxID=591198 RepID=UPI0013C2BF8B|nr:discoidin domain-containing protein [Euzebya tangerina]